MQMGEASEHRPGDYGRWESSLWSPWHQGSHFFSFLVRGGGGGRLGGWVGGLEEETGRGDGGDRCLLVERKRRGREEEGGKSMSWYHSLTCASDLRAAHHPLPNKKKNKGEE